MSKIKLSKEFIKSTVKLALNEDLYPSGDITSALINNDKIVTVKLISNQNAVVAGLLFVKQTFSLIDNKIKFIVKKKDGSRIKKGSLVALIKGKAKNILIAERVALNFLSHISGIATKTNEFVRLANLTNSFVFVAIPEICDKKFRATLSAIKIFFALPFIKATKEPFLILEPSFFLTINFILLSIKEKVCLTNNNPATTAF